jgi:hypothetical protein
MNRLLKSSRLSAALALTLGTSTAALAQDAASSEEQPKAEVAEAPPSTTTAAPAEAAAPAAEAEAPAGPTVKVNGYFEGNYSLNFNNPSNRINNYRSFDSRSDTFTLQAAQVDVQASYGAAGVRAAFWMGSAANWFWLPLEPAAAGGSAAAPTGPDAFRFLQQAYASYNAPIGNGLLIEAGVFLSHVGVEATPSKDNFNWTRSNLYNNLPFYHTGVRATYALSDKLTVMGMFANGWNSVVDGNENKSFSAMLTYKPVSELAIGLTYFGGVERAYTIGTQTYEPWRHLFDLWVTYDATSNLSFQLQADGGMEQSDAGTHSWAAGSLAARLKLTDWLYVAGRGDIFTENAPSVDVMGTQIEAPRMFLLAGKRNISATGTLDFRPADQFSFRVEFRHDNADADLYYKGEIAPDPSGAAPSANAKSQSTLLLGATAWF